MDDSALARVEQQRIELEASIARLRKSLRHWQTLGIDYEGLTEEFLGIPEDSSLEECLQAARDFKADLVDERELQTLLRDNNSRPRRPAQIADILSKRVDYVSRNVEAVRKQLSEAEKKRNALLLAEQPDHRDDAGLPLAEITEELDDSGQVISSTVQTPGSDAPQLIDVLKKAGIKDVEESNGKITKVDTSVHNATEAMPPPDPSQEVNQTAENTHDVSTSQTISKALEPQETFPVNRSDTEAEAELRREMVLYSRGLDDVGAIVAELDLEEDASDVSYDEDDDNLEIDSEFDDDDDFEDEESEDETGKSTHRLTVPRSYRKKMEELQEKLGLKNTGPQLGLETPTEDPKEKHRLPAAEAARKAAIARHENSLKSSLKSAKKSAPEEDDAETAKFSKKKVVFSSELDIASEETTNRTTSTTAASSKPDTKEPKTRPVNDSIVERTSSQNENGPTAPAPAPGLNKQSRFKAARQSQPQTPMFAPPMTFPSVSSTKNQDRPTSPPPPSKIVSADLVERPTPRVSTAPDPDDFSDEAHRREIAMEYQRHRMKRIHSQEGGFIGDGEEDNYGEMITPGRKKGGEDAQGKKISRFKAARIHR
ncbi:uncharacterized protein Z518_04558 [Rhinocladiella mackenziei CBS 650.93]|uniref:DUF3835 domain-containing protein n=1 Tax=Rhinocladiella mackenziei CBS 650.93 TaxID=1442369 RepID=A0A0D2FWK1_9EURO|nr:uncharacterized protein Z518_04558 [Rhinocladiella mackenziei CBS 650.93]KIX06582.1 hypothetical protein Z518_04558 [Rhinocladiella mackenziei CBS 650.93]